MAMANDELALDLAHLRAAARAGLDSLDQVEGFHNIGLAVQVATYDDTGIACRAVEIRLQGEAASKVVEAMRHALEETLAGANKALGEHANGAD